MREISLMRCSALFLFALIICLPMQALASSQIQFNDSSGDNIQPHSLIFFNGTLFVSHFNGIISTFNSSNNYSVSQISCPGASTIAKIVYSNSTGLIYGADTAGVYKINISSNVCSMLYPGSFGAAPSLDLDDSFIYAASYGGGGVFSDIQDKYLFWLTGE